MKLLDKVKKRLEENYGIDFLSGFWTDEQIVLLGDIVEATEKEVNNINYMQCCKSDSELFTPNDIKLPKENKPISMHTDSKKPLTKKV